MLVLMKWIRHHSPLLMRNQETIIEIVTAMAVANQVEMFRSLLLALLLLLVATTQEKGRLLTMVAKQDL